MGRIRNRKPYDLQKYGRRCKCMECKGEGYIEGKMCRTCSGTGTHCWGNNPECVPIEGLPKFNPDREIKQADKKHIDPKYEMKVVPENDLSKNDEDAYVPLKNENGRYPCQKCGRTTEHKSNTHFKKIYPTAKHSDRTRIQELTCTVCDHMTTTSRGNGLSQLGPDAKRKLYRKRGWK